LTKREESALKFINSNKFGPDAWITIKLFAQNVHDNISAIELYGILIEKVDGDNLLSNYNARDALRIKQQIVLDVILKTQILIESTLVLIHSLSEGYKRVASNMTFYDKNLVNNVIKDLGKNKKLKNYNHNLRKVLGLPNLKFLNLTCEERDFLRMDFEVCEANYLEAIKRLIHFYDKFSIFHGKSKHGLTYIKACSLDLNKETVALHNSFVQYFSRIKEMKGASKKYHVSFSSNSAHWNYFNCVGIIGFRKNLFDEVNSVLFDLKSLVSFMCGNHIISGLNCGKVYLPSIKKDSKIALITTRKIYTENKKKIRQDIADKILPSIYFPVDETVFNINYINSEIIESLRHNTITNIHISDSS
jgi:hypothetical protein